MKIGLKGISIHAYHGYYTEEQEIGNTYSIDISVIFDKSAKKLDDKLSKTINYEVLFEICNEEMGNARKLIETVARTILVRVNKLHPAIVESEIKLRKLKPVMEGMVAAAFVEMRLKNK